MRVNKQRRQHKPYYYQKWLRRPKCRRELQQRKRQLADAILSESNSVIADLKREDLDLLLS